MPCLVNMAIHFITAPHTTYNLYNHFKNIYEAHKSLKYNLSSNNIIGKQLLGILLIRSIARLVMLVMLLLRKGVSLQFIYPPPPTLSCPPPSLPHFLQSRCLNLCVWVNGRADFMADKAENIVGFSFLNEIFYADTFLIFSNIL